MTKNFIINQSVYLVYNNLYFDLHNNYSFKELLNNPSEKKVELIWTKLNRDWVKADDPNEIRLQFSGVSFLKTSEKFESATIKTIDEIGYKSPDDNDLDWLSSQEHSLQTDHLFFRFWDDEYIRIYSESVQLSIL